MLFLLASIPQQLSHTTTTSVRGKMALLGGSSTVRFRLYRGTPAFTQTQQYTAIHTIQFGTNLWLYINAIWGHKSCPRAFPAPVFDCLQYIHKQRGKGLRDFFRMNDDSSHTPLFSVYLSSKGKEKSLTERMHFMHISFVQNKTTMLGMLGKTVQKKP